LFGHVKGAFPGALRDRTGRFDLAEGGTLFIDEVCALPLAMQGKLLRALQERKFERVGEERTRTANVRVIAATSADLRQEVKAGRLREDLYFCLNVFPIELLPLRERRDDIPLLAAHFVRGARNKLKISNLRLSEGDARKLTRYDWPGNARELQNVIERAAILARKGRLRIDLPETPLAVRATGRNNGTIQVSVLTDHDRRARDRANITAALNACNGRVFGERGAAALLGVKPTTLASRIKSLGIESGRRELRRDTVAADADA
jgi:transcriptional regulator with GAF, ATPase, and Fis domain